MDQRSFACCTKTSFFCTSSAVCSLGPFLASSKLCFNFVRMAGLGSMWLAKRLPRARGVVLHALGGRFHGTLQITHLTSTIRLRQSQPHGRLKAWPHCCKARPCGVHGHPPALLNLSGRSRAVGDTLSPYEEKRPLNQGRPSAMSPCLFDRPCKL